MFLWVLFPSTIALGQVTEGNIFTPNGETIAYSSIVVKAPVPIDWADASVTYLSVNASRSYNYGDYCYTHGTLKYPPSSFIVAALLAPNWFFGKTVAKSQKINKEETP